MPSRALLGWSLATTVGVYLLMLLGGVVSSSGAGLACPDWPLCHGRLVPPLEGPVLLEYGHRLMASLVGVMVVVTAGLAWRTGRREIRAAAVLALLLLLVQVVLGGFTVLLHLPPAVSSAHLAVGLALFTSMLGLAVLVRAPILQEAAAETVPAPAEATLGRWALSAAGLTYFVAVLGGYVRHSGAALACPDWPLCQGRLVPELSGPVLVHLLHRLSALALGLVLLGLLWQAARHRRARPWAWSGAGLALGLWLVQAALGGLTVLFSVPVSLATLHLATGSLILATVLTMGLVALRPELAGPAAEAGPATAGREEAPA